MENVKWLIVVVRLLAGPLLGAALAALVASGFVSPEALEAACARAVSEFGSNSSTALPLRSAGQPN
jgi:hypothetical protein